MAILICAHKPCELPTHPATLPIQVGKAISGTDLNLRGGGDDQGENISHKNGLYCEMTALYYVWKNLDTPYIGLMHYRRLFLLDRKHRMPWRPNTERITDYTDEDIEYTKELLEHYDLITVPQFCYKKSIKEQFIDNHGTKFYNIMKEAISDFCPEYLPAFNQFMEHNNKLTPFNMFIAKREKITPYFEWIFPLLEYIEQHYNITEENPENARAIGYMTERLFCVYYVHQKWKIKHRPFIFVTGKKRHPIYQYIKWKERNIKFNLKKWLRPSPK